MAHYTGPKCRLCRREGTKLYLKGERCESAKCPITRQRSLPGQHGGKRRRRPSEYSLQLREKQKVKRIYGILEEQFRKYVEEASAAKGETGTALLQKLELRLDNVVYRLGLGESRNHCRQLVRQGKFTVNDKKTDIPSFAVAVGDKIGFANKPVEARKNLIIPDWLSWDKKVKIGTVKRQPEREDLEQDVDETAIIEYYSR
jgi:small subunit ribosomal protein S4